MGLKVLDFRVYRVMCVERKNGESNENQIEPGIDSWGFGLNPARSPSKACNHDT